MLLQISFLSPLTPTHYIPITTSNNPSNLSLSLPKISSSQFYLEYDGTLFSTDSVLLRRWSFPRSSIISCVDAKTWKFVIIWCILVINDISVDDHYTFTPVRITFCHHICHVNTTRMLIIKKISLSVYCYLVRLYTK